MSTPAPTGAPTPAPDSAVKAPFTLKQLEKQLAKRDETIANLRAALAERRPKRPRREVETMEYVTAAARFIRSAGTRVGEGDEHELAALNGLSAVLAAAMAEAVAGQLKYGKSFTDIGRALGTSREAAWQKWGKA